MKPLTLNCTIRWKDCTSAPSVTWCKLDVNAVCVKVKSTHRVAIYQERGPGVENELINYLKFINVTEYDDGLYRCKVFGSITSISHAINVSVSGM